MRAILNLPPNTLVIVAGSTRGGEEKMLLDVYEKIRSKYSDIVLILAPRHIKRAGEIGALIRGRGHQCQLRTEIGQGKTKRSAPILIVDTFGELFNIYSVATVVFCGASLVPLGGQNPLEPAVWGKPILYGPHMEDFMDAKEMLESARGSIRVADPRDWRKRFLRLLEHPEKAHTVGRHARETAVQMPAAAHRHAEVIKRISPPEEAKGDLSTRCRPTLNHNIPGPIDHEAIDALYGALSEETRDRVDQAIDILVETKMKGGRIVAVVGSGPNIHEGVTTLIAELIHKGLIDGVSTSSAVVSHEMAGALEKVKRIDGEALGIDRDLLPIDGRLEVSLLGLDQLHAWEHEIPLDMDLFRRMIGARGDVITKVAGNMAYPSGFRTERLARDVLALARRYGLPFEQVAGLGADPYTMIGAGAQKNVPVLVTVPSWWGGGSGAGRGGFHFHLTTVPQHRGSHGERRCDH
jgi:hypothetical protein